VKRDLRYTIRDTRYALCDLCGDGENRTRVQNCLFEVIYKLSLLMPPPRRGSDKK